MANILKPIGFILILGAVGAGAYYLGQSSSAPRSASAKATDPAGSETAAEKPGEKPGVIQQMKDWVSGGKTSSGGASSARVAEENNVKTSSSTASAGSQSKTGSSKATSGATTLSATVVALSGDVVQTAAKAKVRLLGVKTPSTGFDAAHAREALVNLLGDGSVKLQFLSDDHSTALVWKDGRLLNESMVRLGWSRSGLARFGVAEAEAKRQRVGLWSPEGWMGP